MRQVSCAHVRFAFGASVGPKVPRRIPDLREGQMAELGSVPLVKRSGPAIAVCVAPED